MGIMSSIFGTKPNASRKGFSDLDQLLIHQLANLEASLQRGDAHELFGPDVRDALEKGCEMNTSPIAFMNLALLYSYGLGGIRDYGKAEELLKVSVSQGNPLAYKYLALIEDEIKHDVAASHGYLNLGVQAGDPACMVSLGVDYINGHGVPQNRAEAIRLWEKAARLGDKTAQQNLQKAGR